MDILIKETQQSYYEYVRRVEEGSLAISKKIRTESLAEALSAIVAFSEGLMWLLEVEKLMEKNSYVIESATLKASEYLQDINEAINREDFIFVADLFEYEISTIFSEASDWKFKNE